MCHEHCTYIAPSRSASGDNNHRDDDVTESKPSGQRVTANSRCRVETVRKSSSASEPMNEDVINNNIVASSARASGRGQDAPASSGPLAPVGRGQHARFRWTKPKFIKRLFQLEASDDDSDVSSCLPDYIPRPPKVPLDLGTSFDSDTLYVTGFRSPPRSPSSSSRDRRRLTSWAPANDGTAASNDYGGMRLMARAPWRRGTGASRLMQDLADATVNDVDTRNDTTAAPVMASTAAAPGPVPSHSSTATTAATAASDGSALRVPKKTPSIGRLATSLGRCRPAAWLPSCAMVRR